MTFFSNSDDSDSWQPKEDLDSSTSTTMGSISPNETIDLGHDLLENKDISATSLAAAFSNPRKKIQKKNLIK